MKTQLQTMRKQAGFKSANAFADHMGINRNTYTDYEQGRISLSLELAWEFADALDCSLDELAGRQRPRKIFKDPNQEALNGYYESMNAKGRETLVESARLMSDGDSVRIEKDSPEHSEVSPAMGA